MLATMLHIYISSSSAQTEKIGANLARTLKGGETILLSGDLGAGKTVLVKGLARALKVKQTITSPTFVLMKVYPTYYKTVHQLVHVDCYRLPAGRHGVPGIELENIGIGDYLSSPDTVAAIEWAEKLKHIPARAIRVHIAPGKKTTERKITISRPKTTTSKRKHYSRSS